MHNGKPVLKSIETLNQVLLSLHKKILVRISNKFTRQSSVKFETYIFSSHLIKYSHQITINVLSKCNDVGIKKFPPV